MTDRRALSQILINLASNAIKFTQEGEVRVEIHERTGDGVAVIAFDVVDTGVGIKAEDQAKLFKAFEQLAKYGTAPHEGTGLGLHISQRLAAELQGTISFQSEHLKGSTFTVTLPRNPRMGHNGGRAQS